MTNQFDNMEFLSESHASNSGGNLVNYIRKNRIFLLTNINTQTTANLIGDLAELVESSIIANTENGDKKTNIDMYINSGGGSDTETESIMFWINKAKINKVIINTNVTGYASSNASIIAIQGTKGFRTMNERAYHFVHYGNLSSNVSKQTEISKLKKIHTRKLDRTVNIYMQNTNITRRKLDALLEDEYGYINAEECLKLGFCDRVMTSNGYIER